jgi:hypothetical protein
MFRRTSIAATTLATLAVSLMGLPAHGGTGAFQYAAYSGGTLIRAVGTTISSDMTAQSAISGRALPNSARNSVATVKAGTLADVGAVTTSTTAAAYGDGVKITSHAKTLGVNLLNGAITADAVETTTVTTGSLATGLTSVANTTYVNLHIVGVDLPVNIPKNYKVQISGLATIVINASYAQQSDGVLTHTGYGLGIWLLRGFGGAPSGSTIILNPTFAGVAPPIPVDQPTVGGYAYGTHVVLSAGSEVKGESGKTANVSTPPSSSGGRLLSNDTARAYMAGVLNIGAITSTSRSTSSTSGSAEVINTNEIAGVNLFNGVVTADAIKVVSTSKKENGVLTRSMTLTFVNLVVAGVKIPVDVAPNTTINVAGLGKVVINDQIKTFTANRIRGIYIKLLEPNGGLETGAEVEVAVAASWITQ